MGEPEVAADGPRMGMTRSSLLARAGVVAVGGAALAASPLGLGLARPQAAFAQTPDNEIAPPPPSIGADVPVTYFGPTPSQVQKELVGPVQVRTGSPTRIRATRGAIRFDVTGATMPAAAGTVFARAMCSRQADDQTDGE